MHQDFEPQEDTYRHYELANNLYKETAANFNVKVCNTGEENPWQNGIHERNYAVIDLSVEKMLQDNLT